MAGNPTKFTQDGKHLTGGEVLNKATQALDARTGQSRTLITHPYCAGCGRLTRNGVYMDRDIILDAQKRPVTVNGQVQYTEEFQHLASPMVNQKGEYVWLCESCKRLKQAFDQGGKAPLK